MTSKQSSRPDIYSCITDQIITAPEKGVKPWTQPWQAGNAGHAQKAADYLHGLQKAESVAA